MAFLDGQLGIRQNFEHQPLQLCFVLLLANFHCWTWPNIEQNLYPSGHTALDFKIVQDYITGFYLEWNRPLNSVTLWAAMSHI